MKKVMLFIVSMVFAASASAASMDLSVVSMSGLDDASVAVGSGDALFARGSTHSAGDRIEEVFSVWVETEAPAWSFTITANSGQGSDPSPFSAVLNGVTYVATGANIIFTTFLAAGQYDLGINGLANHTFTGYDIAINAVPIPAALFLFAPALLGFLGLRRKAKLAA